MYTIQRFHTSRLRRPRLSSLLFPPDLFSVYPGTEDIALSIHYDEVSIRAWTERALAVLDIQTPVGRGARAVNKKVLQNKREQEHKERRNSLRWVVSSTLDSLTKRATRETREVAHTGVECDYASG